MSNLNEYLAGTIPLNPTSVFAITQFDLSAGTNVQLSVSAVTNRSYQLLRRDGLDDPAGWMSIGPALPAVSNQVLLVDPNSPTNLMRLYRVRAE